MEELLRLLKEVESDLPITAKELSEEMFLSLGLYENEYYDAHHYKGHHLFIVSNTIEDFFSVTDDEEDELIIDYKGLSPYQGDLSAPETDYNFDRIYKMLNNAFKKQYEVNSSHNLFDMTVPAFGSLINTAFSNLNLMEVISPGEYFYMFNALKKVREEYIDDYI